MNLQSLARTAAAAAFALAMSSPALATSTPAESLTERLVAYLTLPESRILGVQAEASQILDLITADDSLVPFFSSLTASNLRSMNTEIRAVRETVRRMIADGRLDLTTDRASARLMILDNEANARWSRMSANNQMAIIATGTVAGAILGVLNARKPSEESYRGYFGSVFREADEFFSVGRGLLGGAAVGALAGWAIDGYTTPARREHFDTALDGPRRR